jgi:hypothetical protein
VATYGMWARLWSNDHNFSGLDKCCDDFTFFKAHFDSRVGGDDGGNALAADRNGHLGDEAAGFDFCYSANQLVAATDASIPCPS